MVGGDTAILIGSKYLRYLPKEVHEFESGFGNWHSPVEMGLEVFSEALMKTGTGLRLGQGSKRGTFTGGERKTVSG